MTPDAKSLRLHLCVSARAHHLMRTGRYYELPMTRMRPVQNLVPAAALARTTCRTEILVTRYFYFISKSGAGTESTSTQQPSSTGQYYGTLFRVPDPGWPPAQCRVPDACRRGAVQSLSGDRTPGPGARVPGRFPEVQRWLPEGPEPLIGPSRIASGRTVSVSDQCPSLQSLSVRRSDSRSAATSRSDCRGSAWAGAQQQLKLD
eukprot:767601-Hanusia_phi.AAC.3